MIGTIGQNQRKALVMVKKLKLDRKQVLIEAFPRNVDIGMLQSVLKAFARCGYDRPDLKA
jgi:ABC-type dipeptide/oligopeptide/nickel transport system ATPase component